MEQVQTAITGNEAVADATPYAALVQFYRAFNTSDLPLMAQNWAASDEIAMDNPLGGIKRGWAAIEAVYATIFRGPAEVYVEFFDYTLHETAELSYAVGRERGMFRSENVELPLAIRTSRIFRLIDGRWRQVHHHGSIEDPTLLAGYRDAVLGRRP